VRLDHVPRALPNGILEIHLQSRFWEKRSGLCRILKLAVAEPRFQVPGTGELQVTREIERLWTPLIHHDRKWLVLRQWRSHA
jgi:hypothetical protein